MICKEIIKILQEQSPESLALAWDNVGLLVGEEEKEIQRIFIALDATDEAIWEAAEAGADMLLTHHPMIFKGLKKVNTRDFIGRRVIKLIENQMAYYAMHTNFDICVMADLAAERMQLTDTFVLQAVGADEAGESRKIGIGKVGNLPRRMSLTECVDKTKKAFGLDMVKVFSIPGQLQEQSAFRVAICPGSGKSVIADALAAGAEVLITGDIDHHEGIDAAAQGMAVIDAGHYGVEKIFIPYMKQYLEKRLPEVQVIAQKEKQPFLYV